MAADERDLDQIRRWNSRAFEATDDKCVHALVEEKVSENPAKIAIDAWDGKLTYRELDDLSSKVAQILHARGVRPGGSPSILPLCFEKSKWTSVAMLATMKAGGVCVALDVSQPKERLRSIVEQTRARWILCTTKTWPIAQACSGSNETIVELEQALREDSIETPLPQVCPTQTVFVTFTSGSTGRPKGACISHANVAAAVHHQGRPLGFHDARVLDFAPYSFDVAWSNVLHTLCTGSCLCVPRANDMLEDVTSCIDIYQATLINITPTMLRTLEKRPASLRTILLSGEPPSPDLLSKWAGQVSLKNTYGPAECTFKSTFADVRPNSDFVLASRRLGTAYGARTWIINAEDQSHLVRIGEVGELWLEGPLVGQGYLFDAERTSAAFVSSPSWLPRSADGPSIRLYRTGDLVRYEKDGSLVFVGRKDGQVKIQGCRVELGEVEYHVRQCLACDASVEIVVEAVVPKKSDAAGLLVFLTTSESSQLPQKLAKVLPSFMVPTAFVFIPGHLPRTCTGKTDRMHLREIGSSLSLRELAVLNRDRTSQRPVSSFLEHRLRQCWAKTLNINGDDIEPDDSFFHLGGDSIRAVRLVGAAREEGLSFGVADIFKRPRLCDLAEVAREHVVADMDSVEPFSLLQNLDRVRIPELAAAACGTKASEIEDVFPCTPFQAGLFALSMQRPGAYVSVRRFVLPSDIDINRFRRAWETVVNAASILRTRTVHLEGEGMVQVVLRHQTQEWETTEDLNMIDVRNRMRPGTPLVHFSLTPRGDKHIFQWTMHHALLDGFSRSIIQGMVTKAYTGGFVRPPPPFQRFVKHIAELSVREASQAWKSHFSNSTASVFPELPSLHHKPASEAVITHTVADLHWPAGDNITPATLVSIAWAILMTKYTSSPDVVFGTIAAGRDAGVPGVEHMAGPTAATIPVRVVVHRGEETVQELLARTQEQRLAMQQFEQFGLPQIRRASPEADLACNFQTLMVIHPIEACEPSPLFRDVLDEGWGAALSDAASTYALMLAFQLQPTGVHMTINFDPAVLDSSSVKRMQGQFEAILRQLCSKADRNRSIASISTLSSSDLKDIQTWNTHVPKQVPKLVHDLLSQTAQQDPDAIAIHAWDGDLTYGQLDDLSTRAAQALTSLVAVQPNDIIPISSEKSFWTSVAVLTVMKAGAASLTLDVSQPQQRLRKIIAQATPKAILASPAYRKVAQSLVADMEVISLDMLLQKRSVPEQVDAPSPKPSDALFVVFTSGSTGTPKGIVISHENFSSALVHQNKRLGFNRKRRVFDFASYAFDASYYNLLHTLYSGGCLCVPSEEDRLNDLSGSICRLGANFANLTPKLAAMLDEYALHVLDLVELCGETADMDNVARLRRQTSVRFAYGPAECTVLSTVCGGDATESAIGRGVGVCCWVVDSSNPDLLAPVGCVGELWIEGPLVGIGYLGDQEKTAAAFIEDPIWLSQAVGRSGRVYRTGDLVRYASDGSLHFIGRNDSQIKIRGQRVELTEVAYHVQQCLSAASPVDKQSVTVLAEVDKASATLVAFIIPPDGLSMTAQELKESINLLTVDTQQRLSSAMPSYMVPSSFIPLHKVPLTATGKLDRQHLRILARQSRTGAFLSAPSTSSSKQLSDTESHLRSIWARVLKISEQKIDQNTPFWSVGDSITAMSLTVAIRKEFGVDPKLSSLTRHQTTLGSLSRIIEEARVGIVAEEAPSVHTDLEEMLRELDLSASMSATSASSSSPAKSEVVLLTGATGYLGIQILHDLLLSNHSKMIVVLVRAHNADAGLARIKRAAEAAGWWQESAAQFIEVWCGDLSKPRLGLEPSRWNRLAGTSPSLDPINIVIHNGASVHWTSSYETLKAINVSSTFQVLTSALQSPHLQRFVYISGGRNPQGPEHLNPKDEVSAYVRSKYMSEKMVLGMAEHPCQPRGKYTVVKPGCIIGNVETGSANADDFLWRYVRTCIKLGAFPREDASAWLPVAELSTVSQHILRQVDAQVPGPYSVVDSGISIHSFWQAVQDGSDSPLAEMDEPIWTHVVRTQIEEDGETHPLWPVQQFLGPLGMRKLVHVDKEQSQERVEPATRLQLAIAENVRHLRGDNQTTKRDGGLESKWPASGSRVKEVSEKGQNGLSSVASDCCGCAAAPAQI
ncbi:non-ribosomal peptide synthetase like protein [Zymoseptoria brevis]|uniref:Non-ribosomal peptide synthetase like protein n=1 Tax=Zymoseptoria brevis TaxID=1047168 RepID=A0A0F4GAB7_9PEZI|nr:non-ribosomal peptide synthetase like protein [Zymoseptoria brevis]